MQESSCRGGVCKDAPLNKDNFKQLFSAWGVGWGLRPTSWIRHYFKEITLVVFTHVQLVSIRIQ